MKNQRGITLIVLVLTIVITIILAGIVLSLVLGPNGIMDRALKTKDAYKIGEYQEKIDLIILNEETEEKLTGKIMTNDTVKEVLEKESWVKVIVKENIDEVEKLILTTEDDYVFEIQIDGDDVLTGVVDQTVKFKNLTWNASTHTASVDLSTVGSEKIEYQINTTNRTWTEGTQVSDLYLYDVIYARVKGKNNSEITSITITDNEVPEVKVSANTTASTTIAAGIVATDIQSGIGVDETYKYYIRTENTEYELKQESTTNTYVFTGLSAGTKYYIKVEIKDLAGNIGTAITSVRTTSVVGFSPSSAYLTMGGSDHGTSNLIPSVKTGIINIAGSDYINVPVSVNKWGGGHVGSSWGAGSGWAALINASGGVLARSATYTGYKTSNMQIVVAGLSDAQLSNCYIVAYASAACYRSGVSVGAGTATVHYKSDSTSSDISFANGSAYVAADGSAHDSPYLTAVTISNLVDLRKCEQISVNATVYEGDTGHVGSSFKSTPIGYITIETPSGSVLARSSNSSGLGSYTMTISLSGIDIANLEYCLVKAYAGANCYRRGVGISVNSTRSQ